LSDSSYGTLEVPGR